MKRKITITLIVVGLLLIGTGIILKHLGTFNDNNTKNTCGGIYQNNSIIVKICEINNKLYYNINDISSGVINKSSTSFQNEEYTFNINNDELTITNSASYNGEYTKKSNYSLNEFYNDNYGNTKYLNSKYNGIYKLNDSKIYLYQVNETEARLVLTNSTDNLYEIRDDESLYYRLGNEDYIITINGNELIYKTVIDGSITENKYSKEKTITINDIINNLDIIKK